MKIVGRALLILAIASIIGLLAYQGIRMLQRRQQTRPAAQHSPVQVEVEQVRLASIEQTLELTGNVEPLYEIQLASKLSGQLEELLADEGDEVREGDTLAYVDRQSILAQMEQADATLKVAKANLKQAEASLEKVTMDRQRMRNLHREGSATKEQLDHAETAYKIAEAQKELGVANVADKQALLKLAEIRLQDCALRAPADAVIASKHAEKGDMVSPAYPVFTLTGLQQVKVEVKVPDTKLAEVKKGQSCSVRVDSYPESTFQAAVTKIGTHLDPIGRAVKVEILVPNEGKLLKPGMFARVKIIVERRENVVVVPEQALQEVDGKKTVFVLDSNQVTARPVTVGIREDRKVEITEGLSAGEVVVVEGALGLATGTPVQVTGETTP